MIALFRLAVVTAVGARQPISEWTDDLESLMEASLKYERDHLRIERVVGAFEVAEIPDEVWEQAQEDFVEAKAA